MKTPLGERAALVAAILGAVTLSCVRAYCENPQGPQHESYGVRFLIPFPNADGVSQSLFYFNVWINNPNSFSVAVDVTTVEPSNVSSTITYDILEHSSEVATFGYEFAMQGQGKFQQHLEVTCAFPVGVQLMGTYMMDGFVPLPVESWDKHYMPVTHWHEIAGDATVVIVAERATSVTITIPAQDSNHLTIFDTINPASSETVTISLEAGEVYQLRREFDISGCTIQASGPIGVVSGSDTTWVGEGINRGAFYDWVPGRSTLGTDFLVPLTPNRQGIGDLLQVMATLDQTHVIISTDFRRIVLDRGMSIIRLFHNELIHVQSDLPVIVVKFSQSGGGTTGVAGHPTMTYIPPSDQFLADTVFPIPEITSGSSITQYVIVVGTKTAVNCVADHLSVTRAQNNVYGTNMAVQAFTISPAMGHLQIECPTPNVRLGVFNYLASDQSSFQVPFAYSQANINPECLQTDGSPGDNVDNDCDGQIDEDDCTSAGDQGVLDCSVIDSGEEDIFGKSFTFLIPEHCSQQDVISLLVTSETSDEVTIDVNTPLETGLIEMTRDKVALTNVLDIVIGSSEEHKAQGSGIFNKTVVVTASAEISATLQMACPKATDDISAVSARLIPNDALGFEYFAITECKSLDCHIQISAPHKGTTRVRIRLRLAGTDSTMIFASQTYRNGELICLELDTYQSAQLTALAADLTGTHILSDKPVSVMSGGKLTNGQNGHYKDGLLEMLPPVQKWGKTHFVLQTPKTDSMSSNCNSFACRDRMKIVASEHSIRVVLTYGASITTKHNLDHAGDFLDLELPDTVVRVDASRPVLILQITQELYFGLEVSASLVIPPKQWHRMDFLPAPSVDGLELYLLLVSDSSGLAANDVSADGSSVILTENANVNVSVYRSVYNPSQAHIHIEHSGNIRLGGQLYGVGGHMGTFYPLAFRLLEINDACFVTRGVRGDMIDNDCDGQIDEEDCITTLASDHDLDGSLNEDCAEQPVLWRPYVLSPPTDIDQSSSILTDISSTAIDALAASTAYVDILTSSVQVDQQGDFTMDETPAFSNLVIDSSSMLFPSSEAILSTSYGISTEIIETTSSTPTLGLGQVVSGSSSVLVESSETTVESSSSTVTSIDSSPAPTLCSCQCPNDLLSTPLDSSQIEQMTSSIQKELYVDEKKVSATKRKYISVNDQRPSAQTVGYFGVCVVAVTFSGIILMDITSLARDIMELVNACKRGG